jgi:hypothetical protein
LPLAYGNAWNMDAQLRRTSRVRVQSFSQRRLAVRCVISKPATLIRRHAWEAVGGLDEALHMALDYDLWWRIFRQFGALIHVGNEIALNRIHDETKTRTSASRTIRGLLLRYANIMAAYPLKWRLA